MKKSILILGLFLKNENDKSSIRTVEDRLAEMFTKENMGVIKSSSSPGKFSRLFNTVNAIVSNKKKYDVAIVPLFGTWPSFLWQEMATRLLKIFRKKIILCIHGGSIPERIDAGAKRFFKALNRADILVAPSAYFAHYFQDKGFNIHVIENPIDLSAYSFHQKKIFRPKIMWMRAFTEIYNPEMALRIAKRLAEKYSDFKMVMAGKNGPLTEMIKRKSNEYHLTGKMIFPGYISQQEKLQFANDYDIYICTNKIDNAPVSLIEFMRLGLPVVSVNVGGIPYLITHEQNGLLVNDDDDEAMFMQINRLIEDRSLGRSISEKAYQFAQCYDEKNIIKKWKALIKNFSE
jgi:glycosyltransferase involved in cell wall biosynthesis